MPCSSCFYTCSYSHYSFHISCRHLSSMLLPFMLHHSTTLYLLYHTHISSHANNMPSLKQSYRFGSHGSIKSEICLLFFKYNFHIFQQTCLFSLYACNSQYLSHSLYYYLPPPDCAKIKPELPSHSIQLSIFLSLNTKSSLITP